MPEIPQMVEQLAGYRIEDGVTHPPLLLSLRRAVWGNVGPMSFKARSVSAIPIDAGAFKLWGELSKEIAAACTELTHLPAGTNTIANLHSWSIAFHASVDRGQVDAWDVASWTAQIEDWVTRVTTFFDHPPVVELDIDCPHCGARRATWFSTELECEIESMAIAVTFTADGMSAVCRTPGCKDLAGEKSQWDGATEITYMARRVGIDVDELADKIREAKTPAAVMPWTPDEPRRFEDFDPNNPDHAALLGEAS